MHIDFRLHFDLDENGEIYEKRLEIINTLGRKILHEKWEEYSDRAWNHKSFSRDFLDDFLYKTKEHFETVAAYEFEE